MADLRWIINRVVEMHPKDCVFAPDIVDLILADIPKDETDEAKLVDLIEAGFRKYEIYCPHEGIDKRKEWGML
jgi:hypothetical protein